MTLSVERVIVCTLQSRLSPVVNIGKNEGRWYMVEFLEISLPVIPYTCR